MHGLREFGGRGGLLLGVVHGADERAADDDAIGQPADGRGLFGRADAEADRQGNIRRRADAIDEGRQIGREAAARAGDAGDADQVDEALRLLGNMRMRVASLVGARK